MRWIAYGYSIDDVTAKWIMVNLDSPVCITHTSAQCSPGSVGLTQARSNDQLAISANFLFRK